ncbi:MAG: MFS transporter [Flavobacteriales bacterium]|nr:MFS transporter [Flavobacteriales bacterium]
MNLEGNINKMYLLKAVKWFMIVMPIIVLFFEKHGLSLTQIMILQATYSFTVAVLEIPSGFFADIYGRRLSLFYGSILTFIGYLIFSFFSGFNEFFIAEILLGIGGSLISGADSALIYDTLLQLKKDEDYTKVEGKNYGIGNVSEGIAGVIGGFLAITSLDLPVYIQTFVLFFSIPISYSLVEPESSYKLAKSIKSIWLVVKETFFEENKLKWYIIYSSSMGIGTLSIAWFVQPFLIEIETPLFYYGIIWAGLNIITGITSYYSYLFKHKNLLIYISLIMVISFILLGYNISMYGLIFIVFIYLIRGIITPTLRNLININSSSERRATVLSLRSFIIRISFAIIAPILGYITDYSDISFVFYSLAMIVGLSSILALYKLKINN